jgi:diadenosine tetraphosphate (Ap4A) HIT family hydrolase
LCSELFAQQQSTWQQMAEGYASLEFIRIREIICNGCTVKVQFNPKRIISTGADVDPAIINKRKCFLCLENLPEAQQGIQYRDDFLILCNPVPIFPRHFTISSIRHIPQDFKFSVDTMLDIARDISPDYSIFYNGPECGASAPDHLHFQATPRRAIPVEWDAVDVRRRKRFYYKNHVAGFTLINYGRSVIIIESSVKQQLLAFLQIMFDEWKKLLRFTKEPMVNVLCSYQENIWRLIIFPRHKHRPDIYFKEGNNRMVISPAAVDMGGLIVTPLEKDFLNIDAKLIEDIFVEVSEQQAVIDNILDKIV